MGKFNLKKGDGDDDSSRLALFGSRSKSKSPAPPSQNPYAQPTIPPDPYTQAKMRAGIIPPQGPPAGVPGQGPPPTQGTYGAMSPPPQRQMGYGNDSSYEGPQGGQDRGYQAGPPPGGFGQGGYAPNQYGNKGYGGDKNGGNPYAAVVQPSGASRYGPGGYGGLGRTTSNETAATDDNRDALFGDARERAKKQQQTGVPEYQYQAESGQAGAEESRNYGAYGDRQLTAEEEEEEDITATKQEIKFMKQQDVSSTRNALAMANAAEESGRNTLARLGDQGDRMHNTEKNLDLAANINRAAEDKAKELKTLNRSMFAVHVNNPFTGKERREKRDNQILERHRMERDQREATREAAFKTGARMNQNFKAVDDQKPIGQKTGASLAERAKYQFEADSEDDQLEDEIDHNLDQLTGAAKRLNVLARATGEEVEAQNKHLEAIGMKSDRVDEQLVMNTARINRIR